MSNAMDKTAVVEPSIVSAIAKYNKTVQRSKKLYAHDETNDANVGDKVRVHGDPSAVARTSAGASSSPGACPK